MKTLYAADLFCGAGGTSTGLTQACEAAGLRLDLTAVNHWPVAVETHAANHPKARHLCESLDAVDPRKIAPHGKLDLLLASPECTHHSIARGGKPVNDQSRATAWHVVRWAEAIRPRCIMVENVREFATWGPIGVSGRPIRSQAGKTFQAWIEALRSLGYTVGYRLLNAADFGAATSRVRLFVFAVRGKVRLSWPEPTHVREPVAGLFGTLPRWRAAREVIDWSLPGESIFTRKRPLSPNTIERIRAGLRKFGGTAAEPFLLQLTHGGRLYPLTAPLPTVTTARRGEIGLVQPFVLPPEGVHRGNASRSPDDPMQTLTSRGGGHLIQPFIIGQMSGNAPRSTEEPIPTVTTTSRGVGLVQPFLVMLNGGGRAGAGGCNEVEEPCPTVTAGGNHHGLCEPFIVPTNYGERPGQSPRCHDVDAPVPTVTGTVTHGVCSPFLVPYYGACGGADSIAGPVRTLTTKNHVALVTPETCAVDIRFRMLQPHELSAAMSFPPDYQFRGTRSDVIKQIGNAVDVKQARANCEALLGIGRAA